MPKTFDLVALGECLVELSEAADGLYRIGYAGDVLNTLFYASRLGMKCGLISQIGTDLFTDGLTRLLDAESIDRASAPLLANRPNGLYAIKTDAAGHPAYNFWRSESAARETLHQTPHGLLEETALSSKHLHISAIALAVMKGSERLVDLARSLGGKTTVSFDTNVRVALWKDLGELRICIQAFGSATNFLFVTDSDDEALYGLRSPNSAIAAYCQMGYSTILYRRGAEGCVLYQDGNATNMPARRVDVVDTTGAGDAFNAGFLRAYLAGEALTECARQANAVASCALGVRGGLNFSFDRAMAEEAISELTRSNFAA